MAQFEIYFSDLKSKKQKEYLEFCQASDKAEINHESVPICVLERWEKWDEGIEDVD